MTIGTTGGMPAYSCLLHAKGEPKCQRWCGDCLASQALHDARKAIQERYTGQGLAAQKGAPNPYRAGSAAAKWWQEGNDTIQPGEAATVQPPQAFYLGGPYQDGTYAVCDVFTGRIVQKFDPQQASEQASDGVTRNDASLKAVFETGAKLQYYVVNGYDSEWTDYTNEGCPTTQGGRLVWRTKPTAPQQVSEPLDLDTLHDLLYTAQRATGEKRETAINTARLLLSKARAAPQQASAQGEQT